MVWPGTQPGDYVSDHDRGLAAGGELVVAVGHRADCWRRFIGRSAWLHSLHRSRPKAARRPPRAPRRARFGLLVVALGDGVRVRRARSAPGLKQLTPDRLRWPPAAFIAAGPAAPRWSPWPALRPGWCSYAGSTGWPTRCWISGCSAPPPSARH